VISDI